ncbi:acyl-CoA N-acyltransferase [Eremomyces bilateralis CBS 781.70]|uniref:Acyl-CoA N-acyltransferase n=1 Tax=Eremomyces bilateralis CBS 781.70 TaxID=1392243 RepID=A0A6G1G0L5_9PEZI|nr:acyl-CoA N-acyltransferase [Eremomyces bilateralis CBS 781.70]KAF1811594.1 acyl-CoA N-acyltransferase [Eremomyces bilateralis CBS 781.70]
MATEPTIRLARRADVTTVLNLIKELAAFENCEDQVEATEGTLLTTLSFEETDSIGTSLGNSGYAKTLLIQSPDGDVAGMALYFFNYSTWRARPGIYLEDLYVRPAYRRRGYAGLLLKELARRAVEMDGGRLEWACLTWNENALKFYEGIGATKMVEWVGLRVDGEALVKLASGKEERVLGQDVRIHSE